MDISFEELEKRMDEYFANVTDEQFEKDLEKAGFSFYNKIKTIIFSDPEGEDDDI